MVELLHDQTISLIQLFFYFIKNVTYLMVNIASLLLLIIRKHF